MKIRIKEVETDKQEDEIISQLKTQMGSLVNNIDTTLDNKTKEQKEGLLTVAGLAVAMPAILGLVAKFGKTVGGIINKVIGKKPTSKEEEENWFNKLGKIADDLHHLYQAPLDKVVAKFVKDPIKAKKVSNFLFHVIVAVMLLASGATAVKAIKSKEISMATLETALATIKGGEIKNYIAKLIA